VLARDEPAGVAAAFGQVSLADLDPNHIPLMAA